MTSLSGSRLNASVRHLFQIEEGSIVGFNVQALGVVGVHVINV